MIVTAWRNIAFPTLSFDIFLELETVLYTIRRCRRRFLLFPDAGNTVAILLMGHVTDNALCYYFKFLRSYNFWLHGGHKSDTIVKFE